MPVCADYGRTSGEAAGASGNTDTERTSERASEKVWRRDCFHDRASGVCEPAVRRAGVYFVRHRCAGPGVRAGSFASRTGRDDGTGGDCASARDRGRHRGCGFGGIQPHAGCSGDDGNGGGEVGEGDCGQDGEMSPSGFGNSVMVLAQFGTSSASLRRPTLSLGRGISRAKNLYVGDPSLRLKSGSAQDDALKRDQGWISNCTTIHKVRLWARWGNEPSRIW